jgi:hypothetical protein
LDLDEIEIVLSARKVAIATLKTEKQFIASQGSSELTGIMH